MRTAVLGATGLVGQAMLRLLADCDWLTGDPLPLVSERSAGCELDFRGRRLTCREVTSDLLAEVDLVLASAGAAVSRRWLPEAAAAGVWSVDNTSAFRMDPQVALVVPEINGDQVPCLTGADAPAGGGIIANPNCSTIQIAMATAPLDRLFGVREVHVTTLQAVSGAGTPAVAALQRQLASSGDLAAATSTGDTDPFPRPIAGNVLPAIGPALPDGSFEEEDKVLREMRKILDRSDDLHVTCTAVRVPVHTGHSAAVRLVCEQPVDLASAARALREFPGVVTCDAPHDYHTPLEIAGRNEVFVGRLRRDPGNSRALLMWVVADNLLKGAAWNSVQIADRLVRGAVR